MRVSLALGFFKGNPPAETRPMCGGAGLPLLVLHFSFGIDTFLVGFEGLNCIPQTKPTPHPQRRSTQGLREPIPRSFRGIPHVFSVRHDLGRIRICRDQRRFNTPTFQRPTWPSGSIAMCFFFWLGGGGGGRGELVCIAKFRSLLYFDYFDHHVCNHCPAILICLQLCNFVGLLMFEANFEV